MISALRGPTRGLWFGVGLAVTWLTATALAADGEVVRGALFDNVVTALRENYYDKEFRGAPLDALVERFRPRALAATSQREEMEATHALLANIPTTHLGLFTKTALARAMGELKRDVAPTLGFELIEYDGKHFAHMVLEGGPAAKAGLLRGDRIVSIDGVPTEESERLGWRTDDAYLPDPPVRDVAAKTGETVRLLVERRPGETLEIDVPVEDYSAWEAAKASARVIEHDGRKLAYIHFWYIFFLGPDELLKEKFAGEFADCDALILDLRGRGGNGMMVPRIVGLFDGDEAVWHKPLIVLINGLSRSAKEVIAYELRECGVGLLVGEPTAGAVIPASFTEVGPDTVLMFPAVKLGRYTDALEGKGVEPHVSVKDAGPFSAGRDPVLETGLREAVRLVEESPPTTAPAKNEDEAVAN